MSVALSGTFIEKMNEALRFSEKNRARAVTETQRLCVDLLSVENARRRALGMPQLTVDSASIRAAVNVAAGNDTRIKSAVDNEQWGYRLTTMYALAELVTAQREANFIAAQQLKATQRQTDLLVELLRVVTGNTSTVPHQRSGT